MIENPSNFSDQFKNFIEHIALTIKNGLNDKLSINKQTLSEKEKTQVKNNIGLPAEIAALKEVLASKSELSNYLLTTGKAASASTADTATKAIQDGTGHVIADNYIKTVSVNGRTITFTRGNGTTFSIVTQDTVSQNTSNWSVSNGTNGWARDNSTGFTIQWGTADTKARRIGFSRSFSSVLSVVSGQWYNSHSGDTDNILSWNNSGYTRSAIGAFKWTWVAVGFS